MGVNEEGKSETGRHIPKKTQSPRLALALVAEWQFPFVKKESGVSMSVRPSMPWPVL